MGDDECTTSQAVSKSTTWLTNACYPFQLLKKLAVSPVKKQTNKRKNFLQTLQELLKDVVLISTMMCSSCFST